VPYAAIMDEYNAICVSLTPIKVMSDKRKKEAKTRFRREFRGDMGEVRAFFRKVEASDFLCGRNGHGWSASFDWLMKSANAIKVCSPKASFSSVAPMSNGRQMVFHRSAFSFRLTTTAVFVVVMMLFCCFLSSKTNSFLIPSK